MFGVDPSYLLMCAEVYWRGLSDPGLCDYFYEDHQTQVWHCLLLWAEESYVHAIR